MKKNVLDYFEDTKNTYPDKIALTDDKTQLSFSQMWKKSENIARCLLKILPHSNEPQVIAIYLPKSHETLLSFFGTLMSGNIYMPLDTKSPIDRIEAILDNIKPSIIISMQEYGKNLTREYVDFLSFFKNTPPLSQEIIELPYKSRISTDPAYIINTSGSTGTPKGVVVSHQNIIDYMLSFYCCSKISPTNTDIVGNQAPLHFDLSVHDVYCPIFYGSQLVLIADEFFSTPNKLISFLQNKKVNYIFWVPSALKILVQSPHSQQTNLAKILFIGEAMPPTLLSQLQNAFSPSTFANLYGPTETTVASTYYLVDRKFDKNDMVPIGKPLANTKIILLDENNNPTKQGEICIGGAGVSLGYYNDPKKTAEVFIQNPTHNLYKDIIYKTGDLGYYNELGELIITGRKDAQIKHMGFRIELGEIEHALLGLEGLENFCIIYHDEIILATDNQSITKMEVFKYLMKKVPKYMLPTQIFYTQIPLNQNGKIDRKKVLELYQTQNDS